MEIVKDEVTMESNEVMMESPVAQYDSNKKYRWNPGTQFVLLGEEFGVILNSLRSILATEDAQRVLLAERANFAAESVLARAVESGQVVEDNSPKKAK